MKISDAGPYSQRIDPHLLTEARERLAKDNRLAAVSAGGKWYHLTYTPPKKVETRLAELTAIQKRFSTKNFNSRLGQTLEIATFRALEKLDRPFFGRYLDLNEHDDSKLYKKEEPPNYIGRRSIPDDRRLDFLIHYPVDYVGVECKNIREWIYPDRAEVRELLDKCLYLNCIPVLIARRIDLFGA
jgi:hypothetical protein